MKSWKMMLKAIALYRDGSKLSQPLSSSNFEGVDEVVMLGDQNTLDETKGPKELQDQIGKNLKLKRKKLPHKRVGHIREARVGGHKVYLRTGEYDDGSLGEIFIDMYKEGASFRGLLNSFAILASKALQYGMPLDELVDSFIYTRFEPAGYVSGHEAIKTSYSVLDYVFRSLGYDYLDRTEFVQVKAVDEVPDDSGSAPDQGTDSSKGSSTAKGGDSKSRPSAPQMSATVPEIKEPVPQAQPSINKGNGTSVSTAVTSSDAKSFGYTGEQCDYCGSMRVRRNGTCTVCEDCGGTSGCS
jgi:ribonucleoside-diphosphate reductase alpha chain